MDGRYDDDEDEEIELAWVQTDTGMRREQKTVKRVNNGTANGTANGNGSGSRSGNPSQGRRGAGGAGASVPSWSGSGGNQPQEVDPFADLLNPIEDTAFGASSQPGPLLDIFGDPITVKPQKVYDDSEFEGFATFKETPAASPKLVKGKRGAKEQELQAAESDVSDFVL